MKASRPLAAGNGPRPVLLGGEEQQGFSFQPRQMRTDVTST